jgi:predicted metal-dependent HD superfamily phosphohydrolase
MMMMNSSEKKKEEDIVAQLVQATTISKNACFDATQFPQLQEELKAHWDIAVNTNTTTTTNNSHPPLSDAWFDRIYRQHNETGRHYHTTVHLKEMLDYLQLLIVGVGEEDTTTTTVYQWYRLAIFFHDAVYNPQSSQNERDSALLFEQFCGELDFPAATKNIVVTLIQATEKHQVIPSSGGDGGDDHDHASVEESLQQVFLDLDMAVLGKQTDAYLAYAALIRLEYNFVPRDVYCEKRAAILGAFLQQPRIYLSNLFHHALEEQARRNLQTEIDILNKGIIPGEKKGTD